MANASFHVSIPSGFINELQKYGNQIAKNLACTFRDELTKEYQNAVAQFYGAYTPRQYKRHGQLYQSGIPFYVNSHSTRYRGGVEITAGGMASVYHDSPSEVLSTAIEGFHGRPSLGIFTAPTIYEHITKYQELLFANCEAYI